jgi:hypothetical protein
MQTEVLTLTRTDRKIIEDIVSHYVSGDRVKTMRSIFKQECTFEHYIYLGQIVGVEAHQKLMRHIDGKVFRMETLRLLN